jgi:undecaprenyl-diphosphatase
MEASIIDILGRATLFTLHAPFLVPFLLIGYFSKKRMIFTRCIFILLFTLILNPYLKSIWKVPLMSHLGEGYAFPSGHMQVAIALWGWLAFEVRKLWLSILIILLLMGVGFSLVHFNYHNYSDVVGSAIFGILTLMVFYVLYDVFKDKNNGYIGVALIMLSIPILVLMTAISLSMWLYEGILIFFTAVCLLQTKFKLKRKNAILKNAS